MLCNSARVYLEIYKVSTHYKFHQIQLSRVWSSFSINLLLEQQLPINPPLISATISKPILCFLSSFSLLSWKQLILIQFSLEIKILIIFSSVFCLCIHNVKILVDNCRKLSKNTIICCCKHCSCLLYASAIFSISRVESWLAPSWPILTFSIYYGAGARL